MKTKVERILEHTAINPDRIQKQLKYTRQEERKMLSDRIRGGAEDGNRFLYLIPDRR